MTKPVFEFSKPQSGLNVYMNREAADQLGGEGTRVTAVMAPADDGRVEVELSRDITSRTRITRTTAESRLEYRLQFGPKLNPEIAGFGMVAAQPHSVRPDGVFDFYLPSVRPVPTTRTSHTKTRLPKPKAEQLVLKFDPDSSVYRMKLRQTIRELNALLADLPDTIELSLEQAGYDPDTLVTKFTKDSRIVGREKFD